MGGVDRPASTCSSCCGAASTSSPRTSSSSRGAAPSSSTPPRAPGVQLRFEASVCAAIPVIKVLRESLVVTNVHRVLGIVNGTTNFMLTEMEAGQDVRRGAAGGAGARVRRGRPDRRRLGRRRRGEDGDPRHGRVQLALRARRRRGRRHRPRSTPLDVAAARELDMVIRLVGAARLLDGQGRRARRAGARRPPSPARRRRGRFQRGDAAGGRDSRDHARGPGRRRDRDRFGRDRRHGVGDRDDGHGLPAERRRLAEPAAAPAGREPLAVLLPPLGRRRAGRARAGRRRRWPSARSRSRVSSSTRTATAPRCTSSRTRLAQGALDEALAAISRDGRGARPPLPFPVVSDRGVAELGWA